MTFYAGVLLGAVIGLTVGHMLEKIIQGLTRFLHRHTALCDRCGAELRRGQ